jgi:hypothetical protein
VRGCREGGVEGRDLWIFYKKRKKMIGRGITYDLGNVGDVVECSSVLVLVVGAEVGIECYALKSVLGHLKRTLELTGQ